MKLIEPTSTTDFFSEGDGSALTIEMRIVELIKLNIPITIKFESKDEVCFFAKTVMEGLK